MSRKRENRNNMVAFRLSDAELMQLEKRCKESGLNQSDYMRSAITGVVIKRVDGFPEFTIQLLRIGNNINQIARILNTNSSSRIIECIPELQKDFSELKDKVSRIGETICR